MSTLSATARRFHFGLNVTDLERSVAFYRNLLGTSPARSCDDYVRFDVADPPLVLALHPSPRSPGGALNHVGFRVASSEALVAVQRRLEMAGISTKREEGVECCYARQTKFWVPDPDANLWEIYTLEEDLDHSGFGGDGAAMPPVPRPAQAAVVWEHILIAPLPETIPHADGTVDEVRLEGTFNLDIDSTRRLAFIAEVHRVLRPGGTIAVHGLVSDRPYPGKPSLPGPAALVQRVPVETEAHDELQSTGFVGLAYEKLGDIHCFHAGGVELREMRLTAAKPSPETEAHSHFVLYRGPLTRVVDERGRTYDRGVRVSVDRSTWERFRGRPYQDQFTCFRCAFPSRPAGA
jgi:catechol 2,3-dioxygenase-like lactoylglutathione lyase family enzyme